MVETVLNIDNIVRKLIKIRCAKANAIQKLQTLKHSVCQYAKQKNGENDFVYSLFPSRKKWVGLNRENRIGKTQIERNELMLKFTVRKASLMKEKPDWFVRLYQFAEKVLQISLSNKFRFSKPFVRAEEKKGKKKIGDVVPCRPICSFKSLEEKIIGSLYNRIITQIFDGYFYENSFAFRASKGNEGNTMSHLKAVRKIKDFRKQHSGNLYVAECDMKKFYDTIDHDVVKMRFSILLNRAKSDGKISSEELRLIKNVFFNYVDVFNFYDDVFVYNFNQNHKIWKSAKRKYHGKECRFGWVEDENVFKKMNSRTRLKVWRNMGVPQGGALSGFIANCMMNYVDNRLKKYWDNNPDFQYLRFCDDMIMIGTDKEFLNKALNDYFLAVKESKLFPHEREKMDFEKMKFFYEGKTRGPYCWGAPSKDVFPWITFVGYDINFEGDTRIRKVSLQKEIDKQYQKLYEIKRLVKDNHIKLPIDKSRKSFFYGLIQSLQQRLVGMSVGRFGLWNYKETKHELCWAQAFSEITNNHFAEKQMRRLDRHRNKIMHRFVKYLKTVQIEETPFPYDTLTDSDFDKLLSIWEDSPEESSNCKKYRLKYYGKPFSYFYHVLCTNCQLEDNN